MGFWADDANEQADKMAEKAEEANVKKTANAAKTNSKHYCPSLQVDEALCEYLTATPEAKLPPCKFNILMQDRSPTALKHFEDMQKAISKLASHATWPAEGRGYVNALMLPNYIYLELTHSS
jgi:type IV secretory pathway VirJ component